MTVKHHIARIAALASALALAAPALADPPQLRNGVAHFRAPASADLGAPDGWAAKYVESGSGATRHPDNAARYIAAEQPSAVASDPAGGFDWRAGVLGVLAFAVALVTVGTVVARTRTRLARA